MKTPTRRSIKVFKPAAAAAQNAPSLNCTMNELLERAKLDPNGCTGRMIAVFPDPSDSKAPEMLMSAFGGLSAHSQDFSQGNIDFAELSNYNTLTLQKLGVAILGGEAAIAASSAVATSAQEMLQATVERPYILVPEYIQFTQVDALSYLQGFRAAADRITADLKGDLHERAPSAAPAARSRAAGETWGLVATRVATSAFSGKGIRVAILDTGLDLGHPDFEGRRILAQSFIQGETPEDILGHGTHVAGTACGPRAPRTSGARYGVEYESDILVGKVLSNSGFGTDGSILAGINWALENRADIINMSLGNRVRTAWPDYTQAGQRALDQNALIIAAAGNFNEPTGQPGNSPSILSVSSIDPDFAKSEFSNFGKVQLAAPGQAIDSSLPRPLLRGFLSGTSMAAPHVAGIAALYAQGLGLRGQALWRHLETTARRLSLPASEMGAGLVQA